MTSLLRVPSILQLQAYVSFAPFALAPQMGELKLDLLEFGIDLQQFHCTDDNKHIRTKVFDIISNSLRSIRIDSIIVEKSKTGPALQQVDKFYSRMLGYLVKYIVENIDKKNIGEVIIITDSIPIKKKRDAVVGAVKITLASILDGRIAYKIMHHESKSIFGLQVADYCNWAIGKKWSAGDTNYYDKIKDSIKSEFDIFRSGATHYYSFPK